MSTTAQLNIPLSFNQIIDLIKQLPKTQQKKLVSLIQDQDEFVLSTSQIALLDKRSKTPVENCISANESVKLLKKKYDL
jgi:hypothetical protein